MVKLSSRRLIRGLARALTPVVLTLALLGALSLSASTATAAVPAKASASCSFKVGKSYPGGPGHSYTVRAGVWKCGKYKGFCPEWAKFVANSTAVKGISKVPGMSQANSNRAMYLANKYYSTTNATKASDVAFAIWSLQGDGAFKKWYKWAKNKNYVNKAQVARVNALLAESKGWKLGFSVKSTSVHVGEIGTGSVTVLNGNGSPVVGVTPKVELVNASFVTKPAKTNGKGVASFTYKPTDVGAVSVKASMSAPSGVKALLTKSSAGRQRIIVGGVKTTYQATATFEKRLGYEVGSVCDTDCDGVAKVTFKSTLGSSGAPARYTFYTGNKVWTTYDVAPGQTVSKVVDIPDGTKVSGTYAFIDKVGGKVISKSVSLGSPYEVVCPPWVKVTFTGDCDCNGAAGITLKLAAPDGTRYYQVVVQKNGQTVATRSLGSTGSAEVPVALNHGDRVVVTFTAYRTAYVGPLLSGKPFDLTWN